MPLPNEGEGALGCVDLMGEPNDKMGDCGNVAEERGNSTAIISGYVTIMHREGGKEVSVVCNCRFGVSVR